MVTSRHADPRRGRLELIGIAGQWGRFRLGPIDLTVEPGEYVVVLGRSGCGKTSLLETVCGLRRPKRGKVLIDRRDVTHHDPARREIGFVPQDYALFPTMSVARNLAYALRADGRSRSSQAESTDRLAEMLGISHLLERRPTRLSGGEKQRVALGRALAAQPVLLLLDEPVSALDEATRQQICAELASLQQRLNVTVLHVCHNLEEMWSVAHKVAILERGLVHQFGAPTEVRAAPATAAVARAMRLGAVLPIERADEQIHCRLGKNRIPWPDAPDAARAVLLRPERVHLIANHTSTPEHKPGTVCLSGSAVTVMPRCERRVVRVDIGEMIDVPVEGPAPERGDTVRLQFRTADLEPLPDRPG